MFLKVGEPGQTELGQAFPYLFYLADEGKNLSDYSQSYERFINHWRPESGLFEDTFNGFPIDGTWKIRFFDDNLYNDQDSGNNELVVKEILLTVEYEKISTSDDGVTDPDEECDDGNSDSGDGCDNGKIEFGYECNTDSCPSLCSPICGDGVRVGNEICDSRLDQDCVEENECQVVTPCVYDPTCLASCTTFAAGDKEKYDYCKLVTCMNHCLDFDCTK